MSVASIMKQLAMQYGSGAGAPEQQDKLGPWAKVLVTAALVVSTAVAAHEVQAQQHLSQQTQQEIMPERSAIHWGGQLGSIFGAAAGAALGGSIADPAVRRVIAGASAEAGRNAGRLATGGLYQEPHPRDGAQAQRDGRQAQRDGAQVQRDGAQVPQGTSDHLDRMGLRAAFAYDEWMRTQASMDHGHASQMHLNQARNRFFQSREALSSSIQSAQMQGHSVHVWAQMNESLHRRVVDEPWITELAAGMAERLNRPGGPGFDEQSAAQARTSLSVLRESMRAPPTQALHERP